MMLHRLMAVLFTFLSASALAEDARDTWGRDNAPPSDAEANKNWQRGMPWPANWGEVSAGTTLWNAVRAGFVNKVYAPGEAANTALKDIPYAMQEGASVEMCTGKKGLLKWASFCYATIVDPELINQLKKGDIVQFLYPKHGITIFSAGPGSSPETTFRIVNKVGEEDEKQCWTGGLYLDLPATKACFYNRTNKERILRILTRDFGPRDGVALTK